MSRARSAVLAASLGMLLPCTVCAAPLTLEDAVRLALTRNERARIADLQVDVAKANVRHALASFLPVLSLNANDTAHTEAKPNNVGQGSLLLTQPILTAPAIPLYRQAKQLLDAQRYQTVDDKRTLAFDTARSFLAVLIADAVLQAAQRQLDSAKANLNDTSARAQAQLNSSNDVTRAQVDLAGAAREVEADKGEAESAYVLLGFIVNQPTPSEVARPTTLLEQAQQVPGAIDPLIQTAIARRPDLAALRHAGLAAHDFAAEPLLRIVPSLGVTGQASMTSNPNSSWHDESIAATLLWTIYDAGARYADKRSRDAQAAIADQNTQALFRDVDAQVRSAVALLVAAQNAVAQADAAAKAARQNVDETSILYRQGLAKAIELVDANDSRFVAEVSFSQAEYQMGQAFLNLRQALGLDPLGAEPTAGHK